MLVTSQNVLMTFCSLFQPCSGCMSGVAETLPLAYTYGLTDVWDQCLRWASRYFWRLWAERHFANMPEEIKEKCVQAVISDIVSVCTDLSPQCHILGSDRVSMLTHTYPHKLLRKTKVTICNHEVDSLFYLWPGVCTCDLQAKKSMAVIDAECPYWDLVLLNNTKLKEKYGCTWYWMSLLFHVSSIISYVHMFPEWHHSSWLPRWLWSTVWPAHNRTVGTSCHRHGNPGDWRCHHVPRQTLSACITHSII